MLEEVIRAGVVLPAPELEREPNMPPAVPQTNKDLWNYMGSPLLLDAVEGEVVSQQEAEVVMEIGAYRRSVNYTALAVGISPERVLELYASGILKLRRWLSK
ncbi:MAG: hypothetical protein HZA49_02925 [Planctomycetes bacterium]|nr:hypothetical protein [Planctomycetota bacterium]